MDFYFRSAHIPGVKNSNWVTYFCEVLFKVLQNILSLSMNSENVTLPSFNLNLMTHVSAGSKTVVPFTISFEDIVPLIRCFVVSFQM